MSDQFVGEIRAFPFNFAPLGWALCNGQLLAIAQNTALFSLLGTTYGGDGRSNFALPNLPGAVALGQGQGAGLSFYELGQTGGSPTVTLLASAMAAHAHPLNADQETATSPSPQAAWFMEGHYQSGPTTQGQVAFYSTQAPDSQLNPAALAPQGGGQPHNNMMPYLALNFCIALQGIYPPRS